MPEPWDTYKGVVLRGRGTRERSRLQSTKLKVLRDLNNTVILDVEMQNLEFSQILFSITLVQYFVTMLLSS